MPSYTYTARDERGQAVNGTMLAATPEALADQLKQMGYFVTGARLVPERTAKAQAWLARFSHIRYDDVVLFNVQLAKMVQVGIPLVGALETLVQQTEQGRLRQVIAEVAKHVEGGSSFSDALARHPTVFSPLYVSMIRSGEVSGRLDEILYRLATFSQQQAELRQQLATALTYPCVLFVVGTLVSTFLVTGIIPKFMRIFLEAGVTLPLPTLLLYRLSDVLRHQWVWLVAVVVVLGVALRWYGRTPAGRRLVDTWLLKLPVIGPLLNKVVLCRVARTLETLISSGVPILASLTIVEQTAGNVVIGDVINSVQASVRQGGSLAGPLKASQVFPPMAVQMISVGEASGTLDHMLGQIAEHYELLVRHGIARSTVFIEPLFLMIMGGVVAFIMASILLPMFRLVNVVHH